MSLTWTQKLSVVSNVARNKEV